jgi:hypothetical protein
VPIFVKTPDGDVSNTAYVSVTAPTPVSITIAPGAASVRVRQTKQFSATVGGTTNTSVTWKVNGIAGGNGTVGTISQSGLYKAPNTVPASPVVSVTATAAADRSKTATASVTVSRN